LPPEIKPTTVFTIENLRIAAGILLRFRTKLGLSQQTAID